MHMTSEWLTQQGWDTDHILSQHSSEAAGKRNHRLKKGSAERWKEGKRFSFNEMDQPVTFDTLTTTRWCSMILGTQGGAQKKWSHTSAACNVTLIGLQGRVYRVYINIYLQRTDLFIWLSSPPLQPWRICLSLSATYSLKISTKRMNWEGRGEGKGGHT